MKTKNTWIKEGIVVAGLGIFTLGMEVWKELHEFRIRRSRIHIRQQTESGEEIRMVFLSDLHGKEYGKHNRDLVEAVKKENPELILIGGDLLTRGDKRTEAVALTLLEQLVKLAPVYMGNGNHEYTMKVHADKYDHQYEHYVKQVQKLGVHVLGNTSEQLTVKGLNLGITGLDISLDHYQHFRTREVLQTEIEERIGKRAETGYQILLAHNPVDFKAYAEWGADLTLSGHLHGGIIHLPVLGDFITPQAKLFPKYSGGTYQKGEKVCVVSRGLGTHTVNLRFMNPAELVTLILHPQKACTEIENQV